MRYAPQRASASPQALSLADAKAHLVLDHSEDDGLVIDAIAAAQAHLEGFGGTLSMALVEGEFTWEVDPDELDGDCAVRAPFGPVVSVTGAEIDGEPVAAPSLSRRAAGDTFVFASRPIARITVTYRAGYPVGGLPMPLRQAMLLHVGSLYEHREIESAMPLHVSRAYDALVSPYRRRRVG